MESKDKRDLSFWQRLLDILNSRGMTQKDLSVKTGIAKQTINNWNLGYVPQGRVLMKLAKTLEVSPFYLAEGTEDPLVIYGLNQKQRQQVKKYIAENMRIKHEN